MNIRTLNLLWEEKIRGTYAVTAAALDNEGVLTRGIPRPNEVRNYDLTRVAPDGTRERGASFTTQTLLELEVVASADSFLGLTANEIYLFHQSKKTRFLSERHIIFVDSSLCRNAWQLAVGYSDMAGSSFEVVLGDMSGHVEWTLDVLSPLSCVTIAPDASYVAYGTEDGIIALLTPKRKQEWQFILEEPIHAVVCSRQGKRTLYGTNTGRVGCISLDGTRLWEITLEGDVAHVALSENGEICAAIVHPAEEEGSRLVCFTGEGLVGWEHRFERRLVGLSLSPNGGFLATSLRDGTAMVYEIVAGEAVKTSTRSLEDPLLRAQALIAGSRFQEALNVLKEALKENPTNLTLFDLSLETQKQWFEEQIATARSLFTASDFAGAVETMEALFALEGQNVTVVSLLNQAKQMRAQQCLELAKSALATGKQSEATLLYQEAIQLQPLVRAYREGLGRVLLGSAASADAEAEILLAQGNLVEGVKALERAQAMTPTPEREKRLERAQVALEFQTGMEHYNTKQYAPAIFQFQKVLARDPEHSEAKRYLQFAQRFAQDTTTEQVQSRFSMLE